MEYTMINITCFLACNLTILIISRSTIEIMLQCLKTSTNIFPLELTILSLDFLSIEKPYFSEDCTCNSPETKLKLMPHSVLLSIIDVSKDLFKSFMHLLLRLRGGI